MTSIWAFLNQTAAVSLVAGILLLIKALLNDKLSPRWQYGICTIIALRIMLPVQLGKGIFMPLQLILEVIKANAEKGLASAYSKAYEPAKVQHIFPIISGKPNSVTDWIFLGYAVGVLVFLLWYLISYIRLQLLLKKGEKILLEEREKIACVAEKYGLKSCKTVRVKGLTSAFVCCGFCPILALPAEGEIDEKIILHELVHLKYHDELQSVVWCILRSLHWCNPFLQYVFNRIQNDMESLCDQRVLERLEGEERREYGVILLNMANEKYARMPGTSSISNGGKNISRRIAAIVRFKKYPKGMVLVSICIACILFIPILMERVDTDSYQFKQRDYEPSTMWELEYAMALARLNRCETLAGALDTYAKGLMYHQGIYLATVSPISEHENLVQRIKESEEILGGLYHIYTDLNLDPDHGYNYQIFDIDRLDKNHYKAYLAFSVLSPLQYNEHSVLIPMEVLYKDGWVVEECGEWIYVAENIDQLEHNGSGLPIVTTYEAVGETGKITISVTDRWGINNSTLNPDAEFEHGQSFLWETLRYEYTMDSKGNIPKESIGVKFVGVDDLDAVVEFPKNVMMTGSGGGSDTDGFSWSSRVLDNHGSNVLELGGASYLTNEDVAASYPVGFRVQIYWDGRVVEELLVKEEESANEAAVSLSSLYDGFSQTSAYMNLNDKINFKKQKDKEYLENKNHGKMQNLSDADLDRRLEEYFFAENITWEEQQALKEALASHGVYQFETARSLLPNLYLQYTEVLNPQIFYNANDETWIVACGGYCDAAGDDIDKQAYKGNVGDKDIFGVRFSETTGSYESFVKRVTANITDKELTKRVETQNRADGDGKDGFIFELQDYMYDTKVLDGQMNYVGYRWFGACVYGSGFEKYGGNVTAVYKHTE